MLWVLIGVIVLVALGQALRLARGLWRGERRSAPLAHEARGPRLLQAGAAVAVIAALAWSALQPYLMVSSVFPGVARYAGIALLGLALVGLVSALCPPFGERSRRRMPPAANNARRQVA